MKILELHYSTAPAGAERVVVDLSNQLSNNNEVILCIIKDDVNPYNSYYLNEVSSKIKYINLKCRKGLELKALWRIYKTIKKEKPDIVHTHGDAITIFLPSLLMPSVSYFHTLHSLADKYIKGKENLKFLYKWFYKNKITPITISKECQNSYIKLYNLNNSIKIENGRSPLKKTNNYKQVEQEIQSLKIHKDDKVFIHVARYSEAKNQSLLFKTFELFKKNKNNHGILILIGAGYEKVQKLSSYNKIGIYWLGTKNNVCDYLLNSDFFVLTSSWEGLPISLLEAISCGVIPICTPAGGIPNVITDKNKGYISQDFSLERFYAIFEEAYNKEKDFNRENLKQYFNKSFSIEYCANQYINAFKTYSKNDTNKK